MKNLISHALRLAAAAAALALALAAPAAAQIGSQGGPMDVNADQMEVFDREGRILLTGNVDITQGEARLRADRVEVFYNSESGANESGFGDVHRVVAVDRVFYVTPAEVARGDRAVYEIEQDTITLTGDVVITRGENVITTTRFVSNLATGESRFDGQQTGERVRAVLYPSGGARPAGEGEGEGEN